MEDNSIKNIRKEMNLSQPAFAAKFNIPLRTVQNWEGGYRNPPIYVIELIRDNIDINKENESLKNYINSLICKKF